MKYKFLEIFESKALKNCDLKIKLINYVSIIYRNCLPMSQNQQLQVISYKVNRENILINIFILNYYIHK